MDQMRQSYYKDLMVYKNQALVKIKKENNNFMHKEDFIDVSFFDSLQGIDGETLKVINAKIDDIKARAENRMAVLIAKNE